MIEPVANVITDLGTDITALVNAAAEREQCSARGLVALGIAESNLCECARRPTDPVDDQAYWPDVSGGIMQQTILYAPIGDGSSSAANIATVMDALSQPGGAIAIAAQQDGTFYRQPGAHLEARAKYTGGQ